VDSISLHRRGSLWLAALALTLSGCLNGESGSESGTIVDAASVPDPDSFVCDPLTDGTDGTGIRTQGAVAELYYLTSEMPRYTQVANYITHGVKVDDLILYFSQLFIPTRPFDRGFVTAGGRTLETPQGDTLYEYFALDIRGRIQRGSWSAGDYQFAVLSDDGAVFDIEPVGSPKVQIQNDGFHPTRMGCASTPVRLGDDDKLPFRLQYFQGPRYHISLILMARPWPTDGVWQDTECGKQGNSRYFDSTQNPPAPQAAYNGLLARGWMPLGINNYRIPAELDFNPCSDPAPTISNLGFSAIAITNVTLTWSTDRPATRQVFYRRLSETTYTAGPMLSDLRTQHQVQVGGLSPATDYVMYVRSTTISGRATVSGLMPVRTRAPSL
jgi:hypothetical protein